MKKRLDMRPYRYYNYVNWQSAAGQEYSEAIICPAIKKAKGMVVNYVIKNL